MMHSKEFEAALIDYRTEVRRADNLGIPIGPDSLEKASQMMSDANAEITKAKRQIIAACQPKWQDIATAPKDGTKVDLWVSDKFNDEHYQKRECKAFYYNGKWSCEIKGRTYLYWMHEPEPPKVGE